MMPSSAFPGACRLLVFLVFVGLAQPAAAQWYFRQGNFSSTAGEGYARGMGALVAAAGAANMMNSEAAQNYADARSAELDNRLKATQTYFEMRRVNQEARDAERDRRKVRSASAETAEHEAPPRAAPSQIDPHTGQIQWPALLAASDFDEPRTRLDQLFNHRATYGQLDGDLYLSAQDALASLRSILKKNLRTYKSSDYVQATKFLDLLAQEARLPSA
ncbi:MAG: hypothetical protein K1X74_01445 [Pirellulales bacterium]|nr:hypothetical protein [Pirellulales bacterium]